MCHSYSPYLYGGTGNEAAARVQAPGAGERFAKAAVLLSSALFRAASFYNGVEDYERD